MKKRPLSLALALVVVCGLLPVTATAATVAQVVPYKYNEVKDFSEGLAAVCDENYKWGIIDKTGKEVIPCGALDCDYVGDGFHDGCLSVGKVYDNYGEGFLVEWSFVDVTGRTIIPSATKRTYSQGMGIDEDQTWIRFHEGLARVWIDGKCGFFDTTGKEIVPCKYDEASHAGFSEGLAAVCVGEYPDEKWGYIDTTGHEVIPCQYQSAGDFANGKAVVTGSTGEVKNGKTVYAEGVIDKSGNVVVPFGQYERSYGREYHDGLKAVQEKSSWGYVNASGGLVIPYQYTEAKDFLNGLAAVKTSNGWGYIDLHGNEVISCQYGEARQLSDGMLAVGVDGKWGFVRVEGLPTEPKPAPAPTPTPTPTSTPTAPDASKDFEINKDGKLTKYKGLGGNVVIPSNATSIGHGAFQECTGLTGVVIPDSVTSIEGLAFDRCTGLTTVTIPNSVTTIGNSAFMGCTGLTSMTIPGSVTSIDQGAFYYCKNLTSVTIPVNVTSLGNAVFAQTGLTDVYYGGSEAQWKTITATSNYEPLLTAATIHYNSAAPAQPVQPTATTAYASTQMVTVDGKPVTFYAYALKDANGNDTNYIKLRDVAQILNGSAAQFQVGWDGSITITTKTAYTPNGTEMVQNFTGNQSYAVSTSPVTVNGQPTNLEAITLTDASGGGYTYFKLRDLGAALGFDVSWNAQTGISIDPNSPYNANS